MKARIKNIVDEASGIKSFQLEPESPMKYVAGQWTYVTLRQNSKIKSQDSRLKHHFTISSAPTEDHLQFTTKYREESEYKRYLWSLKPGADVEINGPFGSFVLDEADKRPRLFVAGGIGITPFRSMIKYSLDMKLDLPMTLLYSVKTREEAVFGEMFKIQDSKFNMRVVETSKEGRLDEEKVKKYCPDWKERSWWLCGPPALVEAFVELGQKMGVTAEKIRSEEFTGY